MKTLNKKNILLIFILVINLLLANIFFNTFKNKYFTQNDFLFSSIYAEDVISYYFPNSEKIKNDLKTKSYFESGHEYTNSYLQPRVIYLFNSIINKNEDIINTKNKKIELKNTDLFLYIQIFIYFISVLFLFSRLKKKNPKIKIFFYFSILLLGNPILIQWHFQLGTESLYFSMLLILLGLIISSNNKATFFFIGFLIGTMYLQKTITLLYLIILFIYLILEKKKFFIIYSFVGFSLVILLLGIHNYKRANIFYFTPTQSKTDFFTYLEIPVIVTSEKISRELALAQIKNKHEKFIYNNQLNTLIEADRLKLFKFIQKNSFKTFLNNKYVTTKLIMKNYIHSLVLNPFQVYAQTLYRNYNDYYNSKDHKKWLKYRILISFVFYSFSIIGIIIAYKTISLPINFLFISSIGYFFFY